jgi:3,4-dihydroxyphenylacetate 2,3-dioxygenase
MSAINTHWIQPPFNIVRAAHVELGVADLARARAFYVDVLGFVVSAETADALYLRGYEERAHHSLVLRRSATAMLRHLGYRVWSPDDLDALARFFAEAGCPTRWVTEGEVGQGSALRAQDPLGFPVEFFYDMAPVERKLLHYDQYHGAQPMRIDHFNVQAPEVVAAYEHYRRLGFRCAEYTLADPPDDRLWAAWMFRKPTVHDIALTTGRGPRLHHVAYALSDASSILRACDVLAAAGYTQAIERGPGRHGLSNAFFLYLRDPDGHRIELYTGDYYTGDPDWQPIEWRLSDPKRATFWGAFAPPSWFGEASVVADFDGAQVMTVREPTMADRPMVVSNKQ